MNRSLFFSSLSSSEIFCIPFSASTNVRSVTSFQVMPSAGQAGQGACSNSADVLQEVLQEPLDELDGLNQAGNMMSATSTPYNNVQPPNTGHSGRHNMMTRSTARYLSNLI